MNTWKDMAKRLTLNPRGVARTLLHRLDESYRPLSPDEEQRALYAIKTYSGVSTDRLLAHLSRGAIRELLDNM